MKPLEDNIRVQSNDTLICIIDANLIDAYIQYPESEFKLNDILSEFVTRDFKEADLERMEKRCIEQLNTLSNTAPVGAKRKRTPADNKSRNLKLLLSIIVQLIHKGDYKEQTKRTKKYKETCRKGLDIYGSAEMFKTIATILKNEKYNPKMLINLLYLMFKNSNSSGIRIFRWDYPLSHYFEDTVRSMEYYWKRLAGALDSSELQKEHSRYESNLENLINSLKQNSLLDFTSRVQQGPFTSGNEQKIWELFNKYKNFNLRVKLKGDKYSLIVKDKTKDKTIENLSRENLIKELKRIAMEPINWDASNTPQEFSRDDIEILQEILDCPT